jgi:hypothetical protein
MREAQGAHAPPQFTCFIVESINKHIDDDDDLDNIFSVLVVNEETQLVNAETLIIEFIILSLTLNHVPVMKFAIPNTYILNI